MRAILVLAWLTTASLIALPASAEVRVTVHGGLVTIVATNATLRQILDEWARVGRVKIVNAERVTGGPMTIELVNVPEGQALDVLLGSVSGYVAAPRAVAAPDASRFDRLLVMPTSAAPPAAAAAATRPSGALFPQMPPPTPAQMSPGADSPQDDDNATPRGPVFSSFPSPQGGFGAPTNMQPGGTPQVVPLMLPQGAQPTMAPTPGGPMAPVPIGVAVPGMPVPSPQQPQQQQAPDQVPAQPRRPNGNP